MLGCQLSVDVFAAFGQVASEKARPAELQLSVDDAVRTRAMTTDVPPARVRSAASPSGSRSVNKACTSLIPYRPVSVAPAAAARSTMPSRLVLKRA